MRMKDGKEREKKDKDKTLYEDKAIYENQGEEQQRPQDIEAGAEKRRSYRHHCYWYFG